jgi:SAM-dependent methyltransferase
VEHDFRWPTEGNVSQLYERYMVPRLFEPLARELLSAVPLRQGDRVLDVACGTGIVARLAASRVMPGGRVTAVDLNPAMLATARACAEQEELDIEWREAEADALPFADASFEAVLCQQGLQFFTDKAAAVREMQRVTAPGGMIALAVNGPADAFNLALADALSQYVDPAVGKRSLTPYSLGGADVLRAICDAAGLREYDFRTLHRTRRVEPTQQWLMEFTAGLPYAQAIGSMSASDRAAMVRDVAARLKDLWDGDSFSVPTDVYLVYALNAQSGRAS